MGEFYSTTTVYGYIKKGDVPEDYRFWLGLLNSQLFWFFIQHTGYVLRGGYFTFKTDYVQPFPVPKKIPIEIVNEIESLVENILKEKKENPKNSTLALEKKIDKIIYQSYGLNDLEISIIEDAELNH